MTIETLSKPPIGDTLGGARAAAGSLGRLAVTMAEVAQQVAESAPPELVRQTAATLQATAQRAMLAVMSMGAHAARLEAYAHCLAAEEHRIADARRNAVEAVEHEAEHDAATYRRAVEQDGETQPAEQWAAEAFDSWLADEGEETVAPLTRDEALAVYAEAFMRAVRGAS